MREKMSEVRIIKRYQNRKLYDTHQSCYVTLEEIAQIIREGHEIQVIDNKTTLVLPGDSKLLKELTE